MARKGDPGLEQRIYAAAICKKYCSKIAALTNFVHREETLSCDKCLHWNNKPCIVFNDICKISERELVYE